MVSHERSTITPNNVTVLDNRAPTVLILHLILVTLFNFICSKWCFSCSLLVCLYLGHTHTSCMLDNIHQSKGITSTSQLATPSRLQDGQVS